MSSLNKQRKNKGSKIVVPNKPMIKKIKKILNAKNVKLAGTSLAGNRIRGRGGYWQDALDWGKKAWSNLNEDETREGASAFNQGINALGRSIGSEFGIGKQLGNAGSWLSRAIGMGKYTVKSNTLSHPSGAGIVNGMNSAMPPSFGTTKKGSDIIFCHREFVADVTSSVNFSAITYPINPGNPKLFPWMSQIANLYEEYEMLGMLVEFKSSSGTSNTAAVPGMGLVLMATDYDPYDNAFNTKRQMEAAEFSSSGVPYSNFLHAIECDPKRNVLRTQYVVPGITDYAQAAGDARFSVLGNLTVATQGQQSGGVTMGELWVTYHVRLSRPVLEYNNTNNNFSQHTRGTNSAGVFTNLTTVNTSGALPFSIVPYLSGVNGQIGITNTANKYTGWYRVTTVQVFEAATGAVPTMSTVDAITVGCELGANLKNNTRFNDCRAWTPVAQYGHSTYHYIIQTIQIKFNTTNASLIIPAMYIQDETTSVDIFIDRIDGEVAILSDKIFSKDEISEGERVRVQCALNQRLINKEVKQAASQLKVGGWVIPEETEDETLMECLQRENVSDYTKDDCKNRLELIQEALTTSLTSSQLAFLVNKMNLIVKKELELH